MNYPDLSRSKIISFDVETYDPELTELGNGVYRKDGNILGVSIANEQGFNEYYNIGHKNISSEERHKNIEYLTHILGLDTQKIGTNILYDMDWIENWLNIKINGDLHDIQIAEPLIDENSRKYSLDKLGLKYLNKGKRKSIPEKICKENNWKGDFRKHLWKMSYKDVREYALEDSIMPIKIFKEQYKILKEEDLLYIYNIEMGIHRLLLQMKKQGVRISGKKINEGTKNLYNIIKETEEYLFNKYGKFNYRSSKQIAKKLDELGIKYNYNPPTKLMMAKGIFKGNPNLDKDALKAINHDITETILKVKGAYFIMNTFFINAFNNHNVNGRIHCNFKPMKTEIGGTKSGRFSSSDPNLQQVPGKEEVFGKLCRSVFIPEENCLWGKLDYSQIEYRLIAHYSQGPKSDEVKKKYNNDPNTDYHQVIMDWTGTIRKDSKVLNFGMAYAMGPNSMSRKFGWTFERARQLIDLYNETVPYVKYTRNQVIRIAKRRGYIKTILKRRARVTQEMKILGKEYSMFNRLIQGSAADLMKKGMKDAYDAGIFDILIPHLTVHDELDVSIPKRKEGFEAYEELQNIMEKAITIKVPIKVDAEVGHSWGNLEKYTEEIKGRNV